MLLKTKGKKAYAIPVANLDIRETIGNWRRLRKGRGASGGSLSSLTEVAG